MSETPTDASRPASRRLDSRLASGVAWTGGMKWLVQLLSWPITLLTAKLLSPSDYGYVALISVITRFMYLITEAGIATAIVSGPELDISRRRQLHSFCTLSGVAAYAVVCLIGYPLSLYLHDPTVLSALAVVGSTLVFEGFSLVPVALLRRSLDFRSTAFADGARSLSDLGITLLLAFLGFRYWSLVIGYCAGIVVSSIVVRSRLAIRFARPQRDQLRDVFAFSRPLLARNIAGFVSNSSDVPIGKLAMSKDALGHYTLAFTIAYAPGDKITQVILRVVPAILGNVRESRSELRRYFLAVTAVITLITFPMFAGIAFIAPELVPLLLGPQWAPMVAVILPLCVYGAITEANAMVPHVLQTLGETRLLMRNGLWGLLLMPVCFFVLSRTFGGAGLATTWVIGAVVLGVRPLLAACRGLDVSVPQFLSALATPLFASTAMLGALWLLEWGQVLSGMRPVSRIATEVAFGAATYSAMAFLQGRSRLMSLWSLGRQFLAARNSAR